MKRYLVLEDNTVFEGEGFGASCDAVGELVFTTSAVGYIETLTDPCYCGQIVVQTFPLIGNYGVMEADLEGKCALSGYVVREWCPTPSNFRCETDLDTFLKSNSVPAICGVDTRELTRLIRERGVMNATLCDTLPESLDAVKDYRIVNAVSAVAPVETERFSPKGEKRFDVVVLNFGAKKSLIDSLCDLGCEVTSVPCNTAADTILGLKPDGVVISGGPGDPSENTAAIKEIASLFGKVSMLGVGLGHQLMALSRGGKTEKQKQGHRGANQPVRDLAVGTTLITTQNHGYTVDADSVEGAKLRFVNANDDTCEGLEYADASAFSVQFEPTRTDKRTDGILEQFCALMKEGE